MSSPPSGLFCPPKKMGKKHQKFKKRHARIFCWFTSVCSCHVMALKINQSVLRFFPWISCLFENSHPSNKLRKNTSKRSISTSSMRLLRYVLQPKKQTVSYSNHFLTPERGRPGGWFFVTDDHPHVFMRCFQGAKISLSFPKFLSQVFMQQEHPSILLMVQKSCTTWDV